MINIESMIEREKHPGARGLCVLKIACSYILHVYTHFYIDRRGEAWGDDACLCYKGKGEYGRGDSWRVWQAILSQAPQDWHSVWHVFLLFIGGWALDRSCVGAV